MGVPVGWSHMGRVEECGPTYVATEFFTALYLPIFPARSIVVERKADGTPTSFEIPLHRASVAAGYLRIWGVVLAIGAVFSTLRTGSLIIAGVGVAGAIAAAFAWRKLGRIDRDGELRRAVYAKHAGSMVDIAHFAHAANRDYVERLRASVVDRARGIMAAGYRKAHDPETEWQEIALDPTVIDVDFLGDVLCLTRYEAARGDLGMGVVHEEIWAKLRPLLERRVAAMTSASEGGGMA